MSEFSVIIRDEILCRMEKCHMKKIMKLCALLCVLVMTLVSFSACQVVDNTKLATVNGEDITKADFDYYYYVVKQTMLSEANVSATGATEFWKETEIDGKNAGDVAKERALEEAVKMAVQKQKATELGITIDEEGRKIINQQKATVIENLGGRGQYKDALKEMGMTEKSLDAFMEHSYYSGMLYAKMSAEDAKYAVSDEAADAYTMENNIAAKHILFSTVDESGAPLGQEDIAAKKKLADETLAKIKGGADFDALMNELSEDPGLATSPNGYEFGRGEMVEPFEKAAFALSIGGVSELVETNYGYHIIKRIPRNFDAETLASLRESSVDDIRYDIFDKDIETWKNEAKVEVMTKELSKVK